jgi:hypothetical protein
MAAEEDHRTTIDWDADEEALVGWLSIGGKRTRVSATVDIIRQHAAGFNAAVTYEIKRHKQEMFEKLLPCFLKVDASQ